MMFNKTILRFEMIFFSIYKSRKISSKYVPSHDLTLKTTKPKNYKTKKLQNYKTKKLQNYKTKNEKNAFMHKMHFFFVSFL